MEEKGRRVIFRAGTDCCLQPQPLQSPHQKRKENVTLESLGVGHNPPRTSHIPPNRFNICQIQYRTQKFSPTTTNHPTPTNHQIDKQNKHNEKWVVFTPMERVSPRALSLTPALAQPGSRPPPSKSRSRSASWPRRVLLLLRLVLSSGTPMGLRRLGLLLVRLFQHSKRWGGIDEEIVGWLLMVVFHNRQQDSPYLEGSRYVPYMKSNLPHPRTISRSNNSVVLRWAGSEGKIKIKIKGQSLCLVHGLTERRPRTRDSGGSLHAYQEGFFIFLTALSPSPLY